jgi:hypothetical protein
MRLSTCSMRRPYDGAAWPRRIARRYARQLGAPGSLVGTTLVIAERVGEVVMAIQDPTAGASASNSATDAVQATTASAASKRWLIGGFLLAGAAQLITISALLSADPIMASWAELLLASAPAPLAAAAAFTPARLARLATVVAVAALVAGIAGAVLHTGLFFAPALVVLVVGGLKLFRER